MRILAIGRRVHMAWRHNNVGGVTAGQAPHNSSNVGVVTAGQVGHNSSNNNITSIALKSSGPKLRSATK